MNARLVAYDRRLKTQEDMRIIGEADLASFSCYTMPPASAGGVFTPQASLVMDMGNTVQR
jgi:hypothetical protein